MLVCWKCLLEGKAKEEWPLFKVKNSYIFACKKHKDEFPPDDAYSLIKDVINETN